MKELNKELFASIGTLLTIMLFIVVYYAGNSIPPSLFTGINYYEENNHNSCHVIVTEPSIVIRIDDIQNNNAPLRDMMTEILRRDLPMTIGVIPMRIGHEPEFDKFLYKTAQNPKVEIAMHGYAHFPTDRNITEEELEIGFERLASLTGYVPVTYIPPFNYVTPEAYKLLEPRFKIISGTGAVMKSGHVAEIGQTVETFDYEAYNASKVGPKSISVVINACKQGLQKNNLCVVTFHPQELSTNPEDASDINSSNYMHFLLLLDNLERLNATFITLKDTTRCTE
jgi:peptidoglycan/xylan/chitin deacetylase (PgdA/CDA1 family)